MRGRTGQHRSQRAGINDSSSGFSEEERRDDRYDTFNSELSLPTAINLKLISADGELSFELSVPSMMGMPSHRIYEQFLLLLP